MQTSPIVTIQTVCQKLGISFPTANTALENLVKIGVVRETTGRQRGRIYAYSDYLALLDRGTDPLPACDRSSIDRMKRSSCPRSGCGDVMISRSTKAWRPSASWMAIPRP